VSDAGWEHVTANGITIVVVNLEVFPNFPEPENIPDPANDLRVPAVALVLFDDEGAEGGREAVGEVEREGLDDEDKWLL
jgi:hypothetical protein